MREARLTHKPTMTMKPGTCKFYTGTHHNKTCKAGVLYKEVTSEPNRLEGSAFRLPCIQWDKWKSSTGSKLSPAQLVEYSKRGCCSKYEEPSKEEIESYEKMMKEHMDRFMKSFPITLAVKKEFKGKDWKGVKECPICKGKLHMTHSSYNGHVWGKCETEECLSWIE